MNKIWMMTVMGSKTNMKLILTETEFQMIKVYCNELSRGFLQFLKMMMTEFSKTVRENQT